MKKSHAIFKAHVNMSLCTLTFITLLWISADCLSIRGIPNTSQQGNPVRCFPLATYCSYTPQTPYVLTACKDRKPTCRYRCRLGHAVTYHPFVGFHCAPVCLRGYFVGLSGGIETCLKHTPNCPPNSSVILPGTTWHDTICGHPEEYAVADVTSVAKSPSLLNLLRDLTRRWVREIPYDEVTDLCVEITSDIDLTSCIFEFENEMDSTFQTDSLYYRLNSHSFHETANNLYSAVVKPIVNNVEPKVSVQFLRSNPWPVDKQDTLIVATRLTIPMGMERSLLPTLLRWYAGRSEKTTLVLEATEENVLSVDGRYSITAGPRWRTKRQLGFFVYVWDISLEVKDFHCGLFDSVTVDVQIAERENRKRTGHREGLDIDCVWKPRLHASCNCTRALLNYFDPGGLCSPTCLSGHFAYVSKGIGSGDNDDDWTLELSRDPPDATAKTPGRVLYGSVPLTTERFCLVTTGIFNLAPGPIREAPSAPLDVRHCDVVLVEFDIEADEVEDAPAERYLRIPVRSLPKRDRTSATKELRIPLAAKDTLETVIRQGWGGKIGAKVRFSNSPRTSAWQEELAAALDWMLTFRSEQRQALRVVVVDLNIRTVGLNDFDAMKSLYGSKLELIPGLSAGMLAEVLSTRWYDTNDGRENGRFYCVDKQRCAKLTDVYDQDGNLLYTRDLSDRVAECHDVGPPTSQRCVVCTDGAVKILCSDGIGWVTAKNKRGHVLKVSKRAPSRQNETRVSPLTVEQEKAESVLQKIGLLALSHGAFLSLDSISVFPEREEACQQVKPGRWSVGQTALDDPYTIILTHKEKYPERTGLVVFEELCARSNNRAGLVVSVPSADYILAADCKGARLVNRHAKATRFDEHNDGDGGGGDRSHYTMQDLTNTISAMAKWGVSRYSLGYLDYTFSNAVGTTTFTALSDIIKLASAKSRTLHYRYTRHSAFGDGVYPYARVDGVYKLEGGLFFQHATDGTPLVQSFIPVPGVPNLRLGLSSDMNVGAPLTISDLTTRHSIRKVKFLPQNAHIVSLNYKDTVVFVDPERGQVCMRARPSLERTVETRLRIVGVGRKVAAVRVSAGHERRRHEPGVSNVKKYVSNIGTLNALTIRPLALLYCPAVNQSMGVEHPHFSESHLSRANDCVSAVNARLRDMDETISKLGFATKDNDGKVELTKRHIVHTSRITFSLCVTATLLALFISFTSVSILCSVHRRSGRFKQKHQKLQ